MNVTLMQWVRLAAGACETHEVPVPELPTLLTLYDSGMSPQAVPIHLLTLHTPCTHPALILHSPCTHPLHCTPLHCTPLH